MPSIRCSTIKTKNTFFCSFKQKTSLLPCLSLLHYIVQFSRFDLPTAFAARFEDLSYARSSNPTTNVTGMVGPSGLEPPTLRLSVVRSSQLSYGPISTAQGLVPSKLNNELSTRCASHIAANAFAFAQTSDQDVRQRLFRLLVELYVALRAPCNSGRY